MLDRQPFFQVKCTFNWNLHCRSYKEEFMKIEHIKENKADIAVVSSKEN
jgi:hypothetical protein